MDDATLSHLATLLPHPAPDANKYSRGKLTVIAGSAAYPGAACLAAAAGARMGAGYVKVLTDPGNIATVQCAMPSLVVADLDALPQAESWDDLGKRIGHPEAIVIGSGFDAREDGFAELLLAALAAPHPVVVDGGALALCTGEAVRAALAKRREAGLLTVLTPHAGEAARLAAACSDSGSGSGSSSPAAANPGSGSPAVADSQAAMAQRLSCAYGSLIVLKGPQTVIAFEGEQRLMDEGTAALAKAGTGDVLAGMTGALFAQRPVSGMESASQRALACDIAVLAAVLHAYAGRIASETYGDISVVAEDAVAAIPAAIRMLESGEKPGD